MLTSINVQWYRDTFRMILLRICCIVPSLIQTYIHTDRSTIKKLRESGKGAKGTFCQCFCLLELIRPQ